MLDPAAIASVLTGLVGWHPVGDNTGATALPADLLKSSSGLYMQDVSELLTLDVLCHIAPKGEALGTWLARVQLGALQGFVSALAGAQQLSGKVLLADGLSQQGQPQGLSMLKNPGRTVDTVNKLGRFVGLELTGTRYAGVTYQLPAISLQLDGVLTSDLNIYVYSDQSPEPEAIVIVPAGSNRAGYPFVVVPEEAVNITFASDYGGKAWLGYYEDELPDGVHAIYASVGPCGCPNDPFQKWSKYVKARPFAVPANYALVSWDDKDISYEGGSYGLNLFFLGYCDVATVLQSPANQLALAPLLQQAIAIKLLESVYTSPNLTQLASRPDAQADAAYLLFRLQAKLYGGKVPGSDEVYPSALKNTALDFTGLDAVCQEVPKPRISMGYLSTQARPQ